MAEEFPSFDLGFDFLNDQNNEEAGNSLGETATGQKKRFGDVTETEKNQLLLEVQAKATKSATNWAVNAFKEWSSQKVPVLPKLEQMDEKQLDNSLSQFYIEARSKRGEEYSKSSLISFRNAIERHLNNPPYNKSLKLNSVAFTISNRMLNAKIKSLKKQGKENVQHKAAIPVDDLKKLKAGPVLRLTNPWSLLRNVWFHVVLYWCRRVDEQGKRYVTMTHDETSKNQPGGLKDKSSFEKTARMYETDSDTDGYRALSLYISKLNLKCEALFQLPRRNWNEDVVHNIWYENRPLGVNTLGSMMKEISTKAMLSKVYTNHCVRATAITLWSEAACQIATVTIFRATETRTVFSTTIRVLRQPSSENAAMFYHLLYKAPARQRRYLLDISSLLLNKNILDRINSTIAKKHNLNQWKNTTAVINWFKSIENKQQFSFICFDIEEFYPSISQDLLNKALDFASNYDNITTEEETL
ncbi:hypothetical protein P5673_011775 [Acropora cervicornis]|uniref:Uncharacterized protein n=1 Tax=Acropora cervicornis TaxID=6130 RepID=A0AAD9V872_ACRCE|nr:hypothetical protein P5673_011775 [Acropora cervicornis]